MNSVFLTRSVFSHLVCECNRQSEFVSASLDTFGVLCHGDLWRQNVLFFYGSGAGSVIECQTDCLDVRYVTWKARTKDTAKDLQ